jgi:uncharacterized protein
MSLHLLVLEMKKLLGNVDGWLDKAVAHATARKFEPDTLLTSRLAPNMFPLVQQIQAICDHAKYAASRATGKDAPAHPDTEKTLAELRARIAAVRSYLDTFTAADFDGAASRSVSLPRWEGKSLSGLDYVIEHAMPNFFFHLGMTYALLRHNGVEVGKRDYLGTLSFRPAS